MLAILLVGVRVVGFSPYTVLSGSMEPTYSVGDLIYVKTVDPDSIKVGDPITFVANEKLVVATHRVVAVDGQNRFHFLFAQSIQIIFIVIVHLSAVF